ncbi:MAG: sugar-binding domain-containing protein, partial [Tepidisphaeraceae bacterium]
MMHSSKRPLFRSAWTQRTRILAANSLTFSRASMTANGGYSIFRMIGSLSCRSIKSGVADHGYKAMGEKWGTNIGWYRRTFDLAPDDKDKAVWIEFDGVYRNSLVWLNGHCLGRNVSGYSSFSYDLNKYAIFGGKNTLVVRADATRPEGWFYEGAGIYRHVWLMKTAALHVAQWGTYVTSEVNGADANTTIQTDLRNDSDQPATCSLVSTIHDANGNVVGQSQLDSVVVRPRQTQTFTQKIT